MRVQSIQSMNTPHGAETSGGAVVTYACPACHLPHPFFLPSSSRLNDSCLIGHRKRTHIRSTTRKIFNSQMLELINTVSKNALQSWFVSRASRNSGTKAGRRPGMGLAQRQQKCIAGALPQITLEVLRLRRLERRHVQRLQR